MDTFGKRLAIIRKERKMTKDELAKLLSTSISVIGRYERDEMTSSINVAKKISIFLNTTVGYLLGETNKAELFKDPAIVNRLTDLDNMPVKDTNHILHVLDGFVKSVKFKNITAL